LVDEAPLTVPVTLSAYVPAGVPTNCPIDPPPPQALQSIIMMRDSPSKYAGRRFPVQASATRLASITNANSPTIRPNPVTQGGRTFPIGNPMAPAVVETEMLTGTVAVPFNVTELGLTVQVESEGAPPHTRLTV
jgi:hypothetical protein